MEIKIRPIHIRDSHYISEMRRMPGVFENILGTPSEREKASENFIANIDGNSHQFVAVCRRANGDEMVVGTAGIHVSSSPRLRHSAGFGIMVHRDFQNKGVGSKLIEAILDVADNWLMLVRVELTVYTDNQRAIHLYEKYGFKKEGIKKMASIRNGQYEDELLMSRIKLPQIN